MPQLPRLLIAFGIAIAIVGVVLLLLDKFGLHYRLPGDFVIRGKNSTIWLPLTSMLIISALLTILFNLLRRR